LAEITRPGAINGDTIGPVDCIEFIHCVDDILGGSVF
jgi:hypothetical protein